MSVITNPGEHLFKHKASKITFNNSTSGLLVDNLQEAVDVLSQGAKKYSGFENRTDSSIAMNGNNFEITTATSYNVYFTGTGKKTVSATLGVEITEDQNITYVYLDWSGTAVRINKSTSAWDIKDGTKIPLAIVFKDGAIYAITDERHGYNRDLEWHNWAHNTVGAMYYSGLGGTFANTTLSIGNGVIYDEDIRFTIGAKTDCRLWYRNGVSGMRTIAPSNTPYRDTNGDGTGTLQYDDGSGTLASVGLGKYSAQWVYASNDATYPIYVVIGQTSDTLTNVRNSTAPTINLSTAEWKLLYRVIYRNAAGTATYIEAADFRSVQTGVPTNYNPTTHASLTGRDAADSHPANAITGLIFTADKTLTLIDDATLNGTNTGDQDLSILVPYSNVAQNIIPDASGTIEFGECDIPFASGYFDTTYTKSIITTGFKVGADQGAAGAAAGELWADSANSYVIKMGI